MKAIKYTPGCEIAERQVRKYIQKRKRHPVGFTNNEFLALMETLGENQQEPDSSRRRLSDLLTLKVLRDTGERRGGCRVIELAHV
jgi:hypothetical protein